MKTTKIRNSLILLLTATIWGIAFVAQSVGMNYVGPFTFNCVRSIIGGLVLIPCIFIINAMKIRDENKENISNHPVATKETLLTKEAVIGGVLCGCLLCVASNLQQIGIMYTTVGKAGFITALYVVIVPVMGIFLKRKAGYHIWISVVLAIWGLKSLCMPGELRLDKGDLLIFVCAFTFAAHIMVIDYFSPRANGVVISCIQFFTCGIISGVGMLMFEEPEIADILDAWLPIAYAGVMSCGVAYTLQIIGQKNVEPAVASLILSLESVISVIAGWIILNQSLGANEIAGCVIMFIAIILAQR